MKTILTFRNYTEGFHTPNKPTSVQKPPARRRPAGVFDPDDKLRQLRGQIVGITQELLNQPQLSDTDRRLLMISSAVSFLFIAAIGRRDRQPQIAWRGRAALRAGRCAVIRPAGTAPVTIALDRSIC